jgi:hypothetical protein
MLETAIIRPGDESWNLLEQPVIIGNQNTARPLLDERYRTWSVLRGKTCLSAGA